MDYEKKYKEVLDRARKIHNEHKAQPFDVMLKVFPELKENERIRKELTEFLKKASGGFLDSTIHCKTFGKWLAWLEKQKSINNPCKDCINQKGCINCENGNLKET